MGAGRILLAEDSRLLVELTTEALRQRGDGPELVACDDGFKGLSVFTRLVRGNQPPRLVILDVHLPVLEGPAVARSMRAVERGLGQAAVPILFYTVEPADDAFKALLARLGRAVHLQKGADLPIEEQARRLSLAVDRLLTQLGGK